MVRGKRRDFLQCLDEAVQRFLAVVLRMGIPGAVGVHAAGLGEQYPAAEGRGQGHAVPQDPQVDLGFIGIGTHERSAYAPDLSDGHPFPAQ